MSRFFSEKYLDLEPYVPGELPKNKKEIKLNTNENPYPPLQEVMDAGTIESRKLQLYSDPDNLSVTVTCIKNTLGIPFAEINKKMGERGYLLSGGYGALKETTFRIAHMADTTIDEIKKMLKNLDEVVAELKANA